MSTFLDWYASHNTFIIQSLAAFIALLIIIFIFRLFFAHHEATSEGTLAKNATYAQLEEKLNKLLDQQSQMKVSIAVATGGGDELLRDTLGADVLESLSGDSAVTPAGAATTPATPQPAAGAATIPGAGAELAAGSPEQVAEMSRLRVEITTLKESLGKKELEIVSAKEQATQNLNSPQQAAKLDDLSSKISDYEKQIEMLKNRLSDYEIIAEDIADLQKYKKENQDLKSQLSTQPPSEEPISTSAQGQEEGKSEGKSIEELLDEEVVVTDEETIKEGLVPEDIFAAADAALSPEIVAAPKPEVMPEVTADEEDELNNPEAKEVSKGVSREEKVLLNEFEKHFAKDDEE